jgi:histidyl-tRNA synthetase
MAKDMNLLQTPTVEVFVASIGDKLTVNRMKIAKLLWNFNISAEYSHQENPKFKRQLDEVLERGIPFMVVFGTEELEKGVVKVKDMKIHDEVEIDLNEIPSFLISRGCKTIPVTDQSFIYALKSSLP